MGQRHVFSSSQIFESDHDQGWNHGDPSYMHLARPGATNNSTQGYHPENMTIEDRPFMAQWNSDSGSTGYSASSLNAETPQYQPLLPGPSHDPFLHPSAGGNLSMVQDNYPLHHASSSNQSAHTYHGVDGGFFELSMGNGGGLHKRKSTGGPAAYERGNTSRYYDAGSSSDHPIPANCWLEKQNTDSHNSPADFVSGYQGNGSFIGSEGTQRNVRSRSAFDLESNLARTHLSYNTSHHSFAVQNPEHPSTVDLLGQSASTSPMGWSYTCPSSASNGRNMVTDNNFFNHETNHYTTVNPIAPVEMVEYFNDFSSIRNPVPQALHGTSSQFSRGVRSGYTHRPMPPIRASSMNLPVGSAATSDEGFVTENYASRNPRPFSTLGNRTGDRNGSRIFNDRYRSISDQVAFRDRPTPEGLMIMDRSAVYGSRSVFDHHRDMRLDIDNMSYEELLDLGERIGTVNTGLSEDLLSKSLTESIYCSADQLQGDRKCVICLEEYQNMDEVGTLKACGHDFHVGCIRKWLSMKNSCPICKAAALDDKMKQK